ncbi:formylglycine-generating enzyme family protein [Arthrobacter flavus]|uniref:Formylglycine-generating enzyme family protein n=1 Tax=Arthrobacter flavus TaxID=95172 RepID=A0ABW4QBV4_9MICC
MTVTTTLADRGRREGMHFINGGSFTMGSDVHYPEEAPARRVQINGFRVMVGPVTNAQFAAFVRDTGHRTVAERPLRPEDYPTAPPENLVPGSLVFVGTAGPVDLRHLSQWWRWTPGACWRRPEGPGSRLANRADHPVVHVAYEDAEAYASWAGLTLPTEAQWEYAARGGIESATFTWGAEPEADSEALANYWHGDFPWRAERGYGATSPIGSFPANGYGLYDMAGNVWEWTKDWYVKNRWSDVHGCCVPLDPRGGTMADSVDRRQPQFAVPRKVVKGGSYLCADSYCLRYRPSARRPQMVDTGMSHIGFRCVESIGVSKVD